MIWTAAAELIETETQQRVGNGERLEGLLRKDVVPCRFVGKVEPGSDDGHSRNPRRFDQAIRQYPLECLLEREPGRQGRVERQPAIAIQPGAPFKLLADVGKLPDLVGLAGIAGLLFSDARHFGQQVLFEAGAVLDRVEPVPLRCEHRPRKQPPFVLARPLEGGHEIHGARGNQRRDLRRIDPGWRPSLAGAKRPARAGGR